MNQLPAQRLRQAIAAAQEALEEIRCAGADRAALADLAVKLYQAEELFSELPHDLANGNTRMCDGCPHLAVVHQALPYGERTVRETTTECVLTSTDECRFVRSVGFFIESDALPRFLQRQGG